MAHDSSAIQGALTFHDPTFMHRNREQWAATSNLRKDPRKNSTTAIHLRGRGGELDRYGRPLGDRQSFFMGPAYRLVGGQYQFSYPDRNQVKANKLGKITDTRDLLNLYAPTKPVSSSTIGSGVTGGDASGGMTNQTARPQTVPAGSSRGLSQMAPGDRPKSVWADGHSVQILEGVAPPLTETGRPAPLKTAWRPPHIEHRHIEPGICVGRVETKGIGVDTKLVGSKYRYMANLTSEPAPTRDVQTASDATLGRKTLADSVRTYATVHKPMSCQEYEARARGMVGLGAWENALGPLTASMRLGRPSMLQGPSQHMTERLSLAPRASTTRAGW